MSRFQIDQDLLELFSKSKYQFTAGVKESLKAKYQTLLPVLYCTQALITKFSVLFRNPNPKA